MDNSNFQARRAEDLMCPIRDGKNCRGRRCAWCMSLEFDENAKDVCSVAALALVEFMKHYNVDMVLKDS